VLGHLVGAVLCSNSAEVVAILSKHCATAILKYASEETAWGHRRAFCQGLGPTRAVAAAAAAAGYCEDMVLLD
jgi:hypothetical protein